MAGEQIAFAAANQAVEKGLSKLSRRNKEIVLSSIQGILGITLCIVAARQLYRAFICEGVEVKSNLMHPNSHTIENIHFVQQELVVAKRDRFGIESLVCANRRQQGLHSRWATSSNIHPKN